MSEYLGCKKKDALSLQNVFYHRLTTHDLAHLSESKLFAENINNQPLFLAIYQRWEYPARVNFMMLNFILF